MKNPATVHLGYAVGSGEPVAVPLAHTFVTGQTQQSGKTTTLRAIVGRSGRRALAFLTKRGEEFEGRRIPPFLPREGVEPIHWRLVETILASALGQRTMRYERLWLIHATKGATSLAGVRENVVRLLAKAKGGTAVEAYTLIREYLDLVVPDMVALGASDALDLAPGLNVMDLTTAGPQLQALVIRAALERVNRHEREILTVFPEAWEFAPRGRSAPAKDEAVAMARKGAVLGNFLLCDSQDLAGVETTIRQAASVWILGVQRELNELKRTIDSIPAGIAKPKAAEVATLEVGQFFACWGRQAVKVYVQPVWMQPEEARAVALGRDFEVRRPIPPKSPPPAHPDLIHPAAFTESEEPMTPGQEKKLDQVLDLLKKIPATPPTGEAGDPERFEQFPIALPKGFQTAPDLDAIYAEVRKRLLAEKPVLLRILGVENRIEVETEVEVITANGDSLRGRLALLILGGFFDQGVTGHSVMKELTRRGAAPAVGSLYAELDELTRLGFLIVEPAADKKSGKKYQAVAEAKANVRKVG